MPGILSNISLKVLAPLLSISSAVITYVAWGTSSRDSANLLPVTSSGATVIGSSCAKTSPATLKRKRTPKKAANFENRKINLTCLPSIRYIRSIKIKKGVTCHKSTGYPFFPATSRPRTTLALLSFRSVFWFLFFLLFAPSHLKAVAILRFRQSYSGGATPDFHRFPVTETIMLFYFFRLLS